MVSLIGKQRIRNPRDLQLPHEIGRRKLPESEHVCAHDGAPIRNRR
ncbi:hypothetical protein METHB2_900002 [Candidatus Methylobacter favarea]|uniref:Uncharacterized protein n=1 Tax=Candidatus Methylobacter favarea TaxID=2707345 RepID=A0A8S0XLU4_9GAMM|nr:hypothetical protein METHB2_900002 [Candidatus Methylobacter favarea]